MKLYPYSWPDLRLIFRPFPWHWRFRPYFYLDDKGFHRESYVVVWWLFLEVELWT